jgi:hypothetical protein
MGGTRTTVTSDSYLSGVALPFSFNFFGTPRTTILLSASGALAFSTTNPGATNACLTSTSTNPMIAAFWRHLHPSDTISGTTMTGGVYTLMTGTAPNRRYIVQWYGVNYSGGPTPIDVRAVLKEGRGDIDVCYVNTVSGSVSYDSGNMATAGIHSGTGTTGLQYSCNTPTLLNGLVLTYTAP